MMILPTPTDNNITTNNMDNDEVDGSSLSVEVAPGISEPFRGARETTIAIENGNITTTECVCCFHSVQCIADAAYVICPICKVVNLVAGGEWGVGLGF
jgi:hypothetical protein